MLSATPFSDHVPPSHLLLDGQDSFLEVLQSQELLVHRVQLGHSRLGERGRRGEGGGRGESTLRCIFCTFSHSIWAYCLVSFQLFSLVLLRLQSLQSGLGEEQG